MDGTVRDYPWLARLLDPAAYPTDPGAAGGIARVDTHISHVFLTAGRVYKLRRPVKLAFLDFSDPDERLADSVREIALNRRLAPDVYLGLAPVLVDGERVRVGAISESPSRDPLAAEHCVVMRRLAEGRDLRSLVERGAVTAPQIDRIAVRLAAFHREHSLGAPAPFASDEWLARTTGPARANVDALRTAPHEIAPPDEVEELRRRAGELVAARREDFEARRTRGRVVDGHGDLHSEHVWFERDESDPLMIDCIEFREDFRRIDAASDAAFLAMDLTYRGRADLAGRFLRRYAAASGDYHLFRVVDYFLSYRALVRAKVASLVAVDGTLPDEQREHAQRSTREHLDLGFRFLEARAPGAVVLLCGMIGTGKTTVAEALADATGGVVISSDRVRQHVTAPSGDGSYAQGRYSDAGRAAIYGRMLDEARHVIVSGRTVILDATYSRRAWRDAAADWAREHDVRCELVEVFAPRDEILERLAERAAAGNDASEAGPGLYDSIRAEFEEPVEWPERIRIDTSSSSWEEGVRTAASRIL